MLVEGVEQPFLVDAGATCSTIRHCPPQKVSPKHIMVMGFSGERQKLPITEPLHTAIGNQRVHHPYVVSPTVPMNLLGRDLLIKLGVSILCCADGIILTFPDAHQMTCSEGGQGHGQYMLSPTSDTPYADIYWAMLSPEGPGLVQCAPLTFELKPSAPVWIPQYACSREKQLGIADTVCGLIDAGVLEPSRSQWNTPILPVLKAETGKYRMVHDLRAINGRIVDITLTVPNPHVALADIGPQHHWYTVLDLSNAFFCLPLAEHLRDIFSFTYMGRSMRYTRLPQGFKLSPGLFNKVLKASLADCTLPPDTVLVQYVDDLLIAAPTAVACLQATKDVLTTLAREGYKVSRKKIQVLIKFLINQYIPQHGFPERVKSDNGSH
uniref:ribonuclease H n=1 Tax=Sander lucioperca TaxID=283035 RepID=A0A8C9ZRI9_SANLU